MKLLVAYDGSPCSESAIDDLCRVGLPRNGEAVVITVAEIWLPPPSSATEKLDETDAYIEGIIRRHRLKGQSLLTEAGIMAEHAAERVRHLFPHWTVTSRATYGSPAWEILNAAREVEPDLIVLGSHGRSVIRRFFLGSVSQKVMTEAQCTVRIARGRMDVDSGPGRLAIGFDGSAGSDAAVDLVAKRHWPAGTKVLLIIATDAVLPSASFDEVNVESEWINGLAAKAEKKLEKKGLNFTKRIVEGNPKDVLVSDAEAWNADCIYVGANTEGTRLERFVLGSTTSAVVARAHCSVEVVRAVRSLC